LKESEIDVVKVRLRISGAELAWYLLQYVYHSVINALGT
jgi:hypothetical protein